MAALIPDERCFVLASLIFFLLFKMQQAKSGTSDATNKVIEPHLSGFEPATLFFANQGCSCNVSSTQSVGGWRLFNCLIIISNL